MVAAKFRVPGLRPVVSGLIGTVLAGATVLSQPVSAEMYKWVDADGQTHFTQEPPPPGVEGQAVKPPPPPASPDLRKDTTQKWETYVKDANQQRDKAAEAEKKAEADKAFMEENCRRAKISVESYSVPHALIQEPDGSRKRITEDERQQGLKEAQDRVDKYCK